MFHKNPRVVELPDPDCPRSARPDVEADVLLVGCRGEREGVVLVLAVSQASDPDPLSRTVLEVLRLAYLQVGNI